MSGNRRKRVASIHDERKEQWEEILFNDRLRLASNHHQSRCTTENS